jgi:hypothetical protein
LDWLKNLRESEREREARREARREALSDQRRNFQRQTLLELQEAVQDLTRATGAMHHHDDMAFRRTGEWQRELLAEPLNEQLLLANRRVMLLAVRVRDDSLRATVQRFRGHCSDTLIVGRGSDSDSQLRATSQAAMQSALPLVEQIHDRIGEILRTLDDEEDASERPGSSTAPQHALNVDTQM